MEGEIIEGKIKIKSERLMEKRKMKEGNKEERKKQKHK
jgi:hypothetical protein